MSSTLDFLYFTFYMYRRVAAFILSNEHVTVINIQPIRNFIICTR